jgi:hypothetical protein
MSARFSCSSSRAGFALPEDLAREWRELLMGLLMGEQSRRWCWAQVQRWPDGERGIANGYADE